MKLYTSYITNETKIFELLGRWQQENSDFARICAQFEVNMASCGFYKTKVM